MWIKALYTGMCLQMVLLAVMAIYNIRQDIKQFVDLKPYGWFFVIIFIGLAVLGMVGAVGIWVW